MSDTSESEGHHTLFIVERDDLDDSVPYQVMKVEHPPDSEQAKAIEGAMCQLVEEAESETGEPHRLVTEADTPEITQRHYDMHEERIEEERLVTDGGVDQSEAAIDHAEPCANCGDAVVTMPGMDNHVVVRYNGVTEYSEEYYCNEVCLTEGLA